MAGREYALIVAGGKGTRFGGSLPKQFLELNGIPVLMHTLEAFYRYSDSITVVLVLPGEEHDTWIELAKKFNYQRPLILQAGGASRFQSVQNGLEQIGEGYVAIHDGVRPLVTTKIISESFRLSRIHQCAVATVPLKESIRMIDSNDPATSLAVDRSRFLTVQTPQTFDASLIKDAYRLPEDPTLTDDASVAERSGARIHLFEGSYENIKITTPEDLAIASALLRHRTLQ